MPCPRPAAPAARRSRCRRARRWSPPRPTSWWSAAGRPASARRSARPMPAPRSMLAERYGFLGGNATAALVMPLMSFHTQRAALRAARAAPGCSRPITARASRSWPACWRSLLARLVASGGAIAPALATGYTVPFDPELFKLAALELLDEAGVRVPVPRLRERRGRGRPRCRGVVFETKSGPVVMRARIVIDCTGDGDVAARAGAPLRDRPRAGRPGPADDADVPHGRVPARGVRGLCARAPRPVAGRARPVGPDPRGDRGGRARAAARGHPVLRHARTSTRSASTARASTRVLGDRRVRLEPGRDGRAAASCARSRRSCAGYVPGFEHAYVAQSGVHTGVRETRRITGDYRLTADDVLVGAQVRRRGRARRLSGRHPQSQGQRHGAQAPARRARPTTSRCAACCRAASTTCWSPAAASPAATRPTPPIG